MTGLPGPREMHQARAASEPPDQGLSLRQEPRPDVGRRGNQLGVKAGPRQRRSDGQVEPRLPPPEAQSEFLEHDSARPRHQGSQAGRTEDTEGATVEASSTDLRAGKTPLLHQQDASTAGRQLPCRQRTGRTGPDHDRVPRRAP